MHFITFSRLLGTDGGQIARKVADRLGYKLVDADAIDRKANEMGLSESISEMDEKAPSLLKRMISKQPRTDLANLTSVIYELGKQGDTIFVGRGGHILLRAFGCALHVRVIASHETRIKTLVERGYGQRSAVKAIAQSDHDRGGFMRFAFDVDWNDSRLYDVILNVDKLGIDAAADTVVLLAQTDEIKTCSLKSLETLGNQALASRVYAELAKAGLAYGTKAAFATVEEEGRVRLAGIVDSENAKEMAGLVARKVAGVTSIDNQIRVIQREET